MEESFSQSITLIGRFIETMSALEQSQIHVHMEEGIRPSGLALQKQFHGDTYYLETCEHHSPLHGGVG